MTKSAPEAPSRGKFFVRKPDPDPAVLADLRRRYDAGDLNAAELAREVGLSASTIAKRLFEWGWKTDARTTRGTRRKSSGKASVAKVSGDRRKPSKSQAAGEAKKRAARRAVRPAANFDPPAEWAIDPATTPADRVARALKRLFALAERCYAALDRLIAAEPPFDHEAANRLLTSLIKINGEIARLEGRNGAANDADAGGDASNAGADLARIKNDLVERLVSLAQGHGPENGAGEA